MTAEMRFEQTSQTTSPFTTERTKLVIPPKPLEKPQTVPPIRKPEVEKHHIKRTGKR